MREIKFRAWDGIRMTLSGVYFDNTYGTIQTAADMPLMQYTGLKDKNGVEIYEGDVIEIRFRDTEPVITQCKWMLDAGFSLVQGSNRYSMNFSGSAVEGRYIIGNIYENPELLK